MPEAPARTIVFPIFPGITQLDFTGPAQLLARLPGAKVYAVAARIEPVATDSGFAILPSARFQDCPQGDLLCVPGGHGVASALNDRALIDFITRQAQAARWITSVCTGAFLLGAAGLLQGRRATTHWAYTHLLPLVGATHEPARVVEDGNIVTAGGVTSGIDFALILIARESGEETARAIQLALEYDPAPPFAGGHPSRAAPQLVETLKARVYGKAAADMESALRAINR